MPNWVAHKIEFFGDQKNIDKVLDLIKGEDRVIDFEKLIPMPDNIYQGNLGSKERELYGENNWYDWSCKNWGTKWNACHSDLLADNELYFDTAWSSPRPILETLSKLCFEHNVRLEGVFADEDCGYNTGCFEGGDIGGDCFFIHECHEPESNEAYDAYVSVWGETDCLGKDKLGNWIRYSCEDCPNKEDC